MHVMLLDPKQPSAQHSDASWQMLMTSPLPLWPLALQLTLMISANMLHCRAAIKSRCKDLEPWLLREHTLALQRHLIEAAVQHQQQVADRNMHELIAAEEKQLVTPGSQKKSKTKKVGSAW